MVESSQKMPENLNCEGKRFQLLKVMIRQCIEESFHGLPMDQLASCFSDVSNLQQKKIEKLLQIFVKKGLKFSMNQLSDWGDDFDLDLALQKREELIEEQKEMEGTIAWRPSGSVFDDIRAHDIDQLQTRRKQISSLLESKEEELKALSDEVSKIHSNIADYQSELYAANHAITKLREHLHSLRELSKNDHISLATIPVKAKPN